MVKKSTVQRINVVNYTPIVLTRHNCTSQAEKKLCCKFLPGVLSIIFIKKEWDFKDQENFILNILKIIKI